MKILVINSGSSSIKYKFFDSKYKCCDMQDHTVLAEGLVERIGEPSGRIKHNLPNSPEGKSYSQDLQIENHRKGLMRVAELLMDANMGVIRTAAEITAIGHRVVHGGERFSQPTVIDGEVTAAIEALSPLAPLHNPPNLMGIQVATEMFPDALQVAVFDTAFHQSMPPAAYRYAIPDQLYREHSIRSFGFHGTSHLYVSEAAARYLGKSPEDTNLITAHLGNGCSITAVQAGKSVDTSMGFSPLPGLIMGSRSGDLDPAVVFFLGTNLGMSFREIDRLLNKQSGLIGICGDNDLRDIQSRQEGGDSQAQLALEMYTYRIKKYIGAYIAVLGGVDALVFTAGVGENSPYVRWQACAGLEGLGIVLDAEANDIGAAGTIREIQSEKSAVKVLVVPTNEELEIAKQTAAVVSRTS